MRISLDPANYAEPRVGPTAAAPRPLTFADQAISVRLLDLLDVEIGQVAKVVLAGGLDSLPSYREHIGKLAGLERARTLVEEARRAANDTPPAQQAAPLYPT